MNMPGEEGVAWAATDPVPVGAGADRVDNIFPSGSMEQMGMIEPL
ncbi:hypothetical protein [Ktedonospora formicarum]|nr:hypothetical protein [Ktedonospora formicarum]